MDCPSGPNNVAIVERWLFSGGATVKPRKHYSYFLQNPIKTSVLSIRTIILVQLRALRFPVANGTAFSTISRKKALIGWF